MKNRGLINQRNFSKVSIKPGNLVIKSRINSREGLGPLKQSKSIKNIQNSRSKRQVEYQVDELMQLIGKALHHHNTIQEQCLSKLYNILLSYKKILKDRSKTIKNQDQLSQSIYSASVNNSFYVPGHQKLKLLSKQNLLQQKQSVELIKKNFRAHTHKPKQQSFDERQILKKQIFDLTNETINLKSSLNQKEECILKLQMEYSKIQQQLNLQKTKEASLNEQISKLEEEVTQMKVQIRKTTHITEQRFKIGISCLKQKLFQRQKELLILWRNVNCSC